MFRDVRQRPILLLLSPYVAIPRTSPDSSRAMAPPHHDDARHRHRRPPGHVRLGSCRRRDHAARSPSTRPLPCGPSRSSPRARRHLRRGPVPADRDRTQTASYSVQVPAGTPVKLRVSFGDPTYGYWYGDVFDDVGGDHRRRLRAGETVPGVDLEVPVPVSYSGPAPRPGWHVPSPVR